MNLLCKISLLAFLAPLAACAQEPPAHPVTKELLLASIAAAEEESGARAAGLKLGKAATADRLTGTVVHVDPSKIDPNVAGKLLDL
jgi:hypothetical protein